MNKLVLRNWELVTWLFISHIARIIQEFQAARYWRFGEGLGCATLVEILGRKSRGVPLPDGSFTSPAGLGLEMLIPVLFSATHEHILCLIVSSQFMLEPRRSWFGVNHRTEVG
jgi:hypothetical protein